MLLRYFYKKIWSLVDDTSQHPPKRIIRTPRQWVTNHCTYFIRLYTTTWWPKRFCHWFHYYTWFIEIQNKLVLGIIEMCICKYCCLSLIYINHHTYTANKQDRPHRHQLSSGHYSTSSLSFDLKEEKRTIAIK